MGIALRGAVVGMSEKRRCGWLECPNGGAPLLEEVQRLARSNNEAVSYASASGFLWRAHRRRSQCALIVGSLGAGLCAAVFAVASLRTEVAR